MKTTLSLLLFLLLPPPAMAAAELPQTLSELTTVAEAGDAGAQYRLGLIYLHGEGIPADDAWAITWLRRAARQGHPQALAELKQIYARNGLPLPRELQAPATGGDDTARTGHPGAQPMIPATAAGSQTTPATGMTPDLSNPVNRLRAMATAMDARKRGDRGMAITGFQALAKQGGAEAQYQLALLLLERNAGVQDRHLALAWLDKAASQGLSAAREKLTALRQTEAQFPDVAVEEHAHDTASPGKTRGKDTHPMEAGPPQQLPGEPGSVPNETAAPDTEQAKTAAAVQETLPEATDTTAPVEQGGDDSGKEAEDPLNTDTDAATAKDTPQPEPGSKKGGLSSFLGRIFGSAEPEQGVTAMDPVGVDRQHPPDSEPGTPVQAPPEQLVETPARGDMDSDADAPVTVKTIASAVAQPAWEDPLTEATASITEQQQAPPEPATAPADSAVQAVVGHDHGDQADQGGLFSFLGRIFAADGGSPEMPQQEAPAPATDLPGEPEAAPTTQPQATQDMAAKLTVPSPQTPLSPSPHTHDDDHASPEKPSPQPVAANTASADPPGQPQTPAQDDAVAEHEDTRRVTDTIPADRPDSSIATAGSSPLPDTIAALKPLAEAGNAAAQARLGAIYQAGSLIPRDLRLSLYWYRQAAEQGNAEAEFNLGNMYLLGEGVEVDNRRARDWYQRATVQGHAAAARNLANMDSSPLYASNDTTSESLAGQEAGSEPRNLDSDATEVELSPPAMSAETPRLESGPEAPASDPDIPVPEATEAADKTADEASGSGGLLSFFGRLFGQGKPPRTSHAENESANPVPDNAAVADNTAVDNGPPSPGENIATVDLAAPGNRDSLAEASEDPGDDIGSEGHDQTDTAPASLAEATPGATGITLAGAWETYQRGDDAAALAQFEQLAIQGMAAAQAQLGYMYLVGKGTDMDPRKAYDWLRRGAEQGNADAQYNLAVAYAFGRGVAPDYQQAGHWYRLAAEQGQPQAEFSLGISYARGEGVGQDEEQALAWYTRAAEHGYAEAQYYLGQLYLFGGSGVEKDPATARKWLELAAAQGQDKAGKALAQLGSGTE